MTKDQTEAVKEAVIEYFKLKKVVGDISKLIGSNFMYKLLITGISPQETQEIYLETIVKCATKNIDAKSFEFLKPFIEGQKE